MGKIGLALIALAGLSLPQDREREAFKLAVDVDLVVFNVTVTDDDGRLVPGLDQDDFRVSEDGVSQDLVLFRPESAPATVALVIDGSGSVRERRNDLASAVLTFAAASNAEDEIFVIAFNENVFVRRVVSGDPEDVRRAVLQWPPAGLTAFYDAVVAGLGNLSTGMRDRRAMIVLSDGGDNASRHTLDDVVEAARRSSATIFSIEVYDPYNRERDPDTLRRIADLTGGRAYVLDARTDLEAIWQDVADAIRAQYTLGYYPAHGGHDGAFHAVTISAERDGANLDVRTRAGYLAPLANDP